MTKKNKNISISISGDDIQIIAKWLKNQSNKSSSLITLIKNEINQHGFGDVRRIYPAIIDIEYNCDSEESFKKDKVVNNPKPNLEKQVKTNDKTKNFYLDN